MSGSRTVPNNKVRGYQCRGLLLIGTFSLMYGTFFRYFAKIHIPLPLLNLPLFVGEMMLMACTILLFLKWRQERPRFQKYHLLAMILLGWLFVKVVLSYAAYGPLTFRHAALFYYMLFLLFGYEFFYSEFFSSRVIIFFLIFLIIWIKVLDVYPYARYTFLALYLLLALKVDRKFIKFIFLIITPIVFPPALFFMGSKTYLIAITVTIFSLVVAGLYFLSSMKWVYRLFIIGIILLAFILGIKRFAYQEEVNTFKLSPKFFQFLDHKEMVIGERAKTFQYEPLKPRMYGDNTNFLVYLRHRLHIDKKNEVPEIVRDPLNPEKKVNVVKTVPITDKIIVDSFEDSISRINKTSDVNIGDKAPVHQNSVPENLINLDEDSTNELKNRLLAMKLDNIEAGLLTSRIREEIERFVREKVGPTRGDVAVEKQIQKTVDNWSDRFITSLNKNMNFVFDVDTDVQYNNILFRYFIWRDMVDEIIEQKAFWGINLGKPQRSKRIEITKQAFDEWTRDGWITPHNSFLHMIYRGGIVGFFLVFLILGGIIHLFRKFIFHRSWEGILLSSILIYWIAMANTLVILEFPYNAIPFWSLFGMTLAYAQKFETSRVNSIRPS